jgi:HD-GYP domain-containing protein (c-di-GMP phosphodiesterase class II)
MAGRFGLDSTVQQGILGVFERWDGRGGPNGLAGKQISQAARFAAVAYAFVIFAVDLGPEPAFGRIRRWAGSSLDPAIVEALAAHADSAGSLLDVADTWQAVVDAEPGPPRRVTTAQLDEIALAFANAVDLKSPWLHGHSSGVANLAAAAAAALGRPVDEIARIRRAGLFHDIGRAGISTQIWDKPGPLTTAQREQVRLHPYHTDRVLNRCPALAPLAGLASMHHERLDGSGYFRAAPAGIQDVAARVLAAADVYQALTEDRPYRPALRPDEAARQLEAQALDGEVVRAVIEAVGGTAHRPRPARPAGISDRELDVLRLLVRGLSEREIARQLFISAATVHSHVAHIYEKAAVSTRAGLAMFAMENDLIRPGETPAAPLRIN